MNIRFSGITFVSGAPDKLEQRYKTEEQRGNGEWVAVGKDAANTQVAVLDGDDVSAFTKATYGFEIPKELSNTSVSKLMADVDQADATGQPLTPEQESLMEKMQTLLADMLSSGMLSFGFGGFEGDPKSDEKVLAFAQSQQASGKDASGNPIQYENI